MSTIHPVTQTIIDQIGHQAFRMLGARDLIASPDHLSFKVGRNAKSVNGLRVTLMPTDTYKVEALRFRNHNVKIVETHENIYVDSLHQVIESLTGMYTRL
jgi:hypothetical protein